MTTPTPEPDQPADEAHEVLLTADVQAEVQHHAPCVPECPVCYPETEGEAG